MSKAEKLHADKGYRSRRDQQILRRYGIQSRISRPMLYFSRRLGRHSWAMERILLG